MLPYPSHDRLQFTLPGVQFMQKFVNGQPVGSVRQRLHELDAQSAKVALKAAKLKPGFLVFQAGHDIAEANALAESRERQSGLAGRCPDFVKFLWGKIGPEDEFFAGHGEPPSVLEAPRPAWIGNWPACVWIKQKKRVDKKCLSTNLIGMRSFFHGATPLGFALSGTRISQPRRAGRERSHRRWVHFPCPALLNANTVA